MDIGAIALIGVVTTLVATLIAVLTFSSAFRKNISAEGENRGRMAQRLDEAEEDIDRAHKKIGDNRDTIVHIDKSLTELATGQKFMMQTLEKLSSAKGSL